MYTKKLNKNESAGARDALVRIIFVRLFDWLATRASTAKMHRGRRGEVQPTPGQTRAEVQRDTIQGALRSSEGRAAASIGAALRPSVLPPHLAKCPPSGVAQTHQRLHLGR